MTGILKKILLIFVGLLLIYGSPARAQSAGSAACVVQGGNPAASDSRLYFATTRIAACGPSGVKFGNDRGSTSLGHFDGPMMIPIVDRDSDWFGRLRGDVTSHGGRLIIYVHGYRNGFGDAVDRALALRRQSTSSEPLLVFSWPSEDCLLCYTPDEENNLWTQAPFDELLARLLVEPAITDIVLVSHSMGNRVVLRGLTEADRAMPEAARLKIHTLILASPDVDRAIVERDYLPVLNQPGRHTTIYASRDDQALWFSWKIHGYPRAGDTRCDSRDSGVAASLPRCLPALPAAGGVTLVDTSLVRSGNGHADFVESRAAALDLCRVLTGQADFPGRDPLPGHPNALILTRQALIPANCPG